MLSGVSRRVLRQARKPPAGLVLTHTLPSPSPATQRLTSGHAMLEITLTPGSVVTLQVAAPASGFVETTRSPEPYPSAATHSAVPAHDSGPKSPGLASGRGGLIAADHESASEVAGATNKSSPPRPTSTHLTAAVVDRRRLRDVLDQAGHQLADTDPTAALAPETGARTSDVSEPRHAGPATGTPQHHARHPGHRHHPKASAPAEAILAYVSSETAIRPRISTSRPKSKRVSPSPSVSATASATRFGNRSAGSAAK